MSLKAYSKTISTPIIGIGARPYHATIGIRNLFSHYELIACKGTTKDAPLLEKKIKITYIDNNRDAYKTIRNYRLYEAKTPSDILRTPSIINYLKSLKQKPALLFFKLSPSIEQLVKKHRFILVGSSYRMYKKYENKINFQNLIDKLNIPSPRHIIIDAKNLDYDRIKSSLGEKFVIQIPDVTLGSGTFFIKNKHDFIRTTEKESIKQSVLGNKPLKITRLIDCACSPSMTVCITKSGVLHTNLQKQILDIEDVIENDRRSGVYCGHDWTSSNFNKKIYDQAHQIADKIGSYFKERERFRGIFGIDFVLEKKTGILYPIEANIRLLGSFPMLSMVQENAGQPLLQALQIIDSLPLKDYELDIPALNKEMSAPKIGSQLNIHTKNIYPAYISGEIRPGIYHINAKNRGVYFLRDGIFFDDLKNDDEFLLAGSVPKKNRVYLQHQAICKIISRRSLINGQGKLNGFAKIMVNYVYGKLALKKA
jgi:predicted ATP-grasp superfamily ATP-dependent carboligase